MMVRKIIVRGDVPPRTALSATVARDKVAGTAF
jgi:hypothetical protein